MKLVCPECKNDVDLANNDDLEVEDIVECQMCGTTLEVLSIEGNVVSADVVDEGK